MREFKYKGAVVRPYEPFCYSKSEKFFNGSMGGVARTLLADEHPQAVIIEIETMKKLINADSNGISRTIVAQYGAKGYSCLLRNDGFGITGVMEEVEPKMMQLVGDRGNPSVSVKETAFTVCSSPMSDRGQVVLEPKIAASRGRGKGWQQQLEINESGTSYAITSVQKDNYVMEQNLRMDKGCLVDSEGRKYRIRKLTPRECFRLMDVKDEDIDKIQQAGIAKTNLYKLAGNSIVVSCMFHLFRKLFIEKGNENQQLELF